MLRQSFYTTSGGSRRKVVTYVAGEEISQPIYFSPEKAHSIRS
jgi:hypothetical protein